MGSRLSRGSAVGLVAAVALLLAGLIDRLAPPPSADVGRGSEEAFARGLEPRELPPRQAPRRWTSGRAVLRFVNLPSGPASLEVAVRQPHGAIAVAAGGALLGAMASPQDEVRFPVRVPANGSVEVELRPETFVAWGGRRLGASLDHVTLLPPAPTLPSPGLVLGLLGPALAVALLAMAAGFAPGGAALVATGVTLLEALWLCPSGILRSPYARTLPLLLVGGAGLAAAFAAWARRRQDGAGPWAFAALLAAVLVQGVAATSPLMVVSDVVFHAHKLYDVSHGDLYPVSRTPHVPPFTIPYGVSFYVLLSPLVRAGVDTVALVRGGAALSGIAASMALFGLLLEPRGARASACAVLVLQLLPATFAIYSFGNLSNVFGQTATVLFFAWWAGGAPGGWPLGAALLGAGGLAHLSSLVVLGVLCAVLALARGRSLDRTRLVAVLAGLALSGLYYAHFLGLIAGQIPRLLEGAGQGGEASGAGAALARQAMGVLSQWGAPALALAVLGRPRSSGGALDRDLRAFWIAGLALAVPAVLSPLEVRYLYALTLPVAVAAGSGASRLAARGGAGRAAAWALLLAQAALAAGGVAEAVLHRYRPG